MNNGMNSKEKKAIVIGAVALSLVIAIAVFLIVFFTLGNSDKDKGNGVTDAVTTAPEIPPETNEFDTSVIGPGDNDPENIENEADAGETVNAHDINPEKDNILAIDVSKWQEVIDWKAVRSSGIKAAFIRIGYRGENGKIYKDNNADYNIQKAEEAGLLVGVYFFSTAINETEAAEEARWTLEAVAGYPISYPIVYDCEGFKSPDSRMYYVSRDVRTSSALTYMKTVTDAGYEAMLYGAASELSDSVYWDISQIESLYRVWVAHYPSVTYPEASSPEYSGRVDAWQFTSKGRVGGIDGDVDIAVLYFECSPAEPKKPEKRPTDASTPAVGGDTIYEAVNELVTAKIETNLRSAATTKSTVVKVLKNGDPVTRTGIGSNGWSRLEYDGQILYAITSYLTTDIYHSPDGYVGRITVNGQTFFERNESVTAKNVVNLRALPTTNSEIKGTLSRGEYLTRTGLGDKGWSQLTYNGEAVYAVTNYLTLDEVSAEDTSPEDTTPSDTEDSTSGFTAVNEQVTAKSETNLRTAPNTESSEVVYTLKRGEYVLRTGIHIGGWSRLEYNGQTVYAVTSYLTSAEIDEEGFEAVDEEVTAKTEVNLRTAPDANLSEVVYTLKNGEYVQRIGISQDGWSKLMYDGQIVYALTDYLTV